MMQKLPKWLKERTAPYVGQLVLVFNRAVYPMEWQRGRVTEVFKGRDELVRSVIVKMAGSAGGSYQ